MLIAVVSDTHRMQRYIEAVRERIIDADVLIHLGDNVDDVEELSDGFDGVVYAVVGNCDYSNEYPIERIVELEGVKILATHGHAYNVKCGLHNLYYRAQEVGANIALFGHTHQELVIRENGITIMNPGSVSLPRGKGRYIGFIEIKVGEEPSVYLESIE